MSDELLTGKAKKAKRSEERAKKNQKRKRDDDAAPEDNDAKDATVPAEDGTEAVEKKKSSKKRKQDTSENVEADAEKPKKQRKENPNKVALKGEEESTEQQGSGKHRFIVFIGNLPYSANQTSIAKHFAAVAPTSIRHRTDPKTGKSKGFAFLEFENYDRMKTCLKSFHHSTFDSGIATEKQRKINVELTAGGGGKSDQRKEKLKVKNEKLDEERKRRAEAQAKLDSRKAKKGGKGGQGKDGEEEVVEEEVKEDTSRDGIHPARLAMMHKSR